MIVAWIVAVWLLSLTLFVLLVARQPKPAHPKPPARQVEAWEDAA